MKGKATGRRWWLIRVYKGAKEIYYTDAYINQSQIDGETNALWYTAELCV